MTDIREAVARAICKSNNGDDDEWDIYKTDADAAIAAHIEAIMEPSEAWISACVLAVDSSSMEGGIRKDVKMGWQAILTAMRNEK